MRHGKAHLKQQFAKTAGLEPELLPYRADVLAWLQSEHETGRWLVLASASPINSTQAVADHFGIFDEVLGTDGRVNLRAHEKRDLLVKRYGAANYDYLGDDPADVVVWKAARVAHVVGSKRFVEKVRDVANVGRTFPASPGGRLRAGLDTLRPHQWARTCWSWCRCSPHTSWTTPTR